MLQINEEYQVKVVDYSYDGLGIVKIDGMIVFVENVIVDEEIIIKITKVKKNFAFASLVKIVEKSIYRQEPKCQYFYQCGGCQLMHMNYEEQVRFKKEYVLSQLNRRLGLDLDDISFIYPMTKYRYRNKLIVPFDYQNDLAIAGLYEKESHNIISNTDCLISNEEAFKVINLIKDYLNEYKYFHNIKNVMIRNNQLGEMMVVIVSKSKICQDLVTVIIDNFPKIVSVVNNINDQNTNKILGEKEHLMYGEDYLKETLLGNEYHISSKSFFQINLNQTERLYSEAIDMANLSKEDKVLDAYSGIGTISLTVSKMVKEVLGIEIVEEAVVDARNNAKLNNITNANFEAAKVEEYIQNNIDQFGYLIVDPPRKGLDDKFIETINNSSLKSLVYISCNPSTLIRDIEKLNFELKDITLVDMFVNTYHVETVCLLSKLNVDHHIEVDLNMDELDLTSAESKATYDEIKAYVLANTGLKVTNLYIAQVKDKMGIKERENFNVSKKADAKVPQCPADKEKAIIDALKHFNMIN